MTEIDLSDPTAPRSLRFDDFYFQPGQGIEESRFTFIRGCGLPGAWQDQQRFVIGETGFGTGLNFLLTWQQWRGNRTPGQCLHYVSAEAFPLDHRQLEIAVAAWHELQPLGRQLLANYPPTTPGFHRLVFPQDQIFLTLLIGDAAQQLAELEASVDAWYLDGFAPSKNPEMWSPEVFAQVARLSSPGARLASCTAAGPVRRGLQQIGFEVSKTAGFGGKRERLTGRFIGESVSVLPKWYRPATVQLPRAGLQATIVGAGLAGASLFKSLSGRGIDTRVVESGQASASDNPCANVMPRLSLDISLSGRFFWSAFLHAIAHWRKLPGWSESGTLMLATDDQDWQQLSRLQQCWQLPESLLRLVDATEAAKLAGVPLGVGGLWFAHSGTLAGAEIRHAWLDPARLQIGLVTKLQRQNQRCQLRDDQAKLLADTQLLFLANGPGAANLLPHLPMRGFAGQVSWLAASEISVQLRCTLVNGRYLTPAINGRHLLGSTYNRCDLAKPLIAPDARSRQRNLAALDRDFTALGELTGPMPIQDWSGIRCSTPDHLPLAGPLVAADEFVQQFGFLRHSENFYGELEAANDHGLFGLLALGSRAFTTAPLGAELVVSQALGEPWPLERSVALALHPSRFLVRDLKRHRL
jgi:tRNA 5-methylaminomethyl-2-thiouridine biosynthesis bifunctional protein